MWILEFSFFTLKSFVKGDFQKCLISDVMQNASVKVSLLLRAPCSVCPLKINSQIYWPISATMSLPSHPFLGIPARLGFIVLVSQVGNVQWSWVQRNFAKVLNWFHYDCSPTHLLRSASSCWDCNRACWSCSWLTLPPPPGVWERVESMHFSLSGQTDCFN